MSWVWQPLLPAAAQQLAGGTAYTLPAGAGSHALSGQTAGLKRGLVVSATAGGYSLTGQTAGLAKGRRIVANTGGYAVAGEAVGLSLGRKVAAAIGFHALSGQTASLRRGFAIVGEADGYALSGQQAAGQLHRAVTTGIGSFAITGQDATLVRLKGVIAEPGEYAINGEPAGLTHASIETPVSTATGGGLPDRRTDTLVSWWDRYYARKNIERIARKRRKPEAVETEARGAVAHAAVAAAVPADTVKMAIEAVPVPRALVEAVGAAAERGRTIEALQRIAVAYEGYIAAVSHEIASIAAERNRAEAAAMEMARDAAIAAAARKRRDDTIIVLLMAA